jgi:capsular polysaccharide biosynthesis protein
MALARKWSWVAILFVLAAAGAAALASVKLSPVYYQTTTTVLVRTGNQPGNLTIDQTARTYAVLMLKVPLLRQVVDDLHLHYSPEELQGNITVTPQPDTGLLDIKVQDRDRARAAEIANTLTKLFIAQNQTGEQQQITVLLEKMQKLISGLEQQISTDARVIAVLLANPRRSADEQVQLTTLQAKNTADLNAYATLRKGYDEIRANQVARYETVSVVDPATTPQQAISRNKFLKPLLAGVIGVLVVMGLAFLFSVPAQPSNRNRRPL